MAKRFVKVDASNLKEMLLRFEDVTGKSMPQLVRSFARICAVELANRTQPFTGGGKNGPAVLERGTKHLRKDILRVVKNRKSLEEKAKFIADEKLRLRLQKAIEKGNDDWIAALLKATGTIKNEFNYHSVHGHDDILYFHKANRSKRSGHTLSTRPAYYYAKNGFDPYVSKVAKRLGYCKSGWAEAAREIGGIKGDGARGIPAFAKRHKANNFRVADNSRDLRNPNFVMTNTTPWIWRLLPNGQEKESGDIARHRMIESMNKIIKYVAKNGKDVESVTATEISNATTNE